MKWILGAAAPVLVGALFMVTGPALPSIVGYPLFCAAIVFASRARVRAWLRWDAETARWAAEASLLFGGIRGIRSGGARGLGVTDVFD